MTQYDDIIHPKSLEILDVNSSDCQFRTNIDILNECFGANKSLYMQACYPQKRNEFIYENNTNEKFVVWMPKLYGNSSLWKNNISDDGLTIYETAETKRDEDWMDIGKHDLEALRLVFAKKGRKDPYVFVGAFINGEMKHLSHTYIRVATKVKLIGNPVKKIELLDDSRTGNQIEKENEVIERIIKNPSLEGIDKESIVKIRINQGVFRDRLLRKYGKCCLCEVDEKSVLIASHIKPWTVSSPSERVDDDNGLLLCPNHDKVFDKGLISFDDEGNILISGALTDKNLLFLNINPNMKISISTKGKEYMKYHREMVYLDSNNE